jgi:hypothetical protein
MWVRIRAVFIEDEPLAARYLAELRDDTCQVEVVGIAGEANVLPTDRCHMLIDGG